MARGCRTWISSRPTCCWTRRDVPGCWISIWRWTETEECRASAVRWPIWRPNVALNKYYDAIGDLKAAGELRREGEQLALLAYCCNQVSWDTEAIGLYEEAIRRGYRAPGVYNNLGFSCFPRGRYDDALEALESAVAISGDRLPMTLFNVQREVPLHQPA
jgi:tetratricopeptide (TPR) repeat protein